MSPDADARLRRWSEWASNVPNYPADAISDEQMDAVLERWAAGEEPPAYPVYRE